MLFSCLKRRKNTESKNSKVVKTKKWKNNVFIKLCSVSEKSRFIKDQEACGLLSSFGIKTPFSQIPLIGPILF